MARQAGRGGAGDAAHAGRASAIRRRQDSVSEPLPGLSSAGRPRSGEDRADAPGRRLALAPAGIPARILINGKEGKIGLMPPLGEALTDEQIASGADLHPPRVGPDWLASRSQDGDGHACSHQGPCTAVDR